MQLKREIKKYIIENFLYGQDDDTLNDEVSFLEKGIIDSTGVLELVSFVQDTYGIQVLDDEIVPDNFDSIGKLEIFIMRKKEKKVLAQSDVSQASMHIA
jgi:acyl carrier protein